MNKQEYARSVGFANPEAWIEILALRTIFALQSIQVKVLRKVASDTLLTVPERIGCSTSALSFLAIVVLIAVAF